MVEISEKNFEAALEAALLAGGLDDPEPATSVRERATSEGDFILGGFNQRQPEDYSRSLCLVPEDAMAFVQATQPKEWGKLKNQYGEEAKERFLQRLDREDERRGTLDVLRKGIKDVGARIQLAYYHPSSGLNPELQKKHAANLFSVVRQVKYSLQNENSLDLVLFLNGLPILTAELKNPLTGQNVHNAIKQYQKDRDPKEPLFAFGRCLAHFAVDPELVYFTTHLQGQKTRFFPFNKGRYGGAGNPPSWKGFATAYLWEQLWARDSLLNLIQQYLHIVEEEDDEGRKTGDKWLIFPRYHQVDAVRRLLGHARANGPGQRYLIQHSTGSGKSFTIAWLAHQLSVLHDDKDLRVFDSIIVVTDRRVLDRQLQRTVRQFEQTLGMVENIDQTSRQLKQALEDGKNIIVTTLQKFPVISNQMAELPGSRFAVIVDEAHSSQGGEAARHLRSVLSTASLEEAEQLESGEPETLEDRILEEIQKRGRLPNVSHFAFTATPKAKTLEMFGTKRPNGKYEAFSLYSMRQAIEEKFILDVLEHYTTYHTYWNLLKKIEEDPRYDRDKAVFLLKRFVDLHEHTIDKKLAVMVEHFAGYSRHRIGGKAKAMIVTRSRLHAVRYKRAIDQYLKDRGYPYKALVAFSGAVRDGGIDYTETAMNGFPETQTAKTFERDEYRFLIVAEKFQTGFDQPLLHTMYVDKKLSGLHAVQTLSRLNRIHAQKEETMVLDFANEADDIQESFKPWYEKTLLSQETDPNLLYDLETRLAGFELFTPQDVDRFAGFYFDPKATQDKLLAVLDPVATRYASIEETKKVDFKGTLQDYVRLYGFLSQILTFADADLEKLYVFGRYLLRRLPASQDQLPVEITQKIDLNSYRMQIAFEGSISLPRGMVELEPQGAKMGYALTPDEIEALSKIIKELNERFGTDFSEDDKVFIEQLESRLIGDPVLENSLQVNTRENFRLTFDNVVNDVVQEMIDSNFKFYKQINDDFQFARTFFDWLFERYLKGAASAAGS
jgi:type I restriction enzyme R subunit